MEKRVKTFELSKEARKQAIADLQSYFLAERDEELGELAAGFLLDFFLVHIGPAVYNQAIRDAQTYMNEKVEDMDGLQR